MRDVVLTLFVFGSIPFILRRPWIGIMMWTWLSLMSPHRLTWGFAFSMPFAQVVAAATLISLVLSAESKKVPWTPLTVVWALFVVWMCITTIFALNPEGALEGLEKSLKIQLFCFITIMLMRSEERLKAFVWIVVLSLGFFGVKGGIFTILTGGAHRVWGPPGSFVGGNNEMAFALIVVLPLMRFLQMHAENAWVRRGLGLSMLLCTASVVGSHSRGAFLAVIAMGLFLVWKSRKRALMVLAMVVVLPIGLASVPDHYWERMETIKNYEEDASAMGRLNAWGFALNMLKDNPITGGGFETFTPSLFIVYAPDPLDHHDVHSIFFEILGEQGWVGFTLYMIMALLAYRYAGWTANRARGDPATSWQVDLARMTQVCLVGYAAGGAFLGLAYFDLYYDIIAIILVNRVLLERRLAERDAPRTQELGLSGPPRLPVDATGLRSRH